MSDMPASDHYMSFAATGGETRLDVDWQVDSEEGVRIVRTRGGLAVQLVLAVDYTIGQLVNPRGAIVTLLAPALAGDVYEVLDLAPGLERPVVHMLGLWRGAWTAAAVYRENDTVLADGSSYICLALHVAATNSRPGTGVDQATYWKLVASKGDTGNVGPTGPANTLAIGAVTTGVPGSAASATITGAAPNQTLNLTIPRGDVGATGSIQYPTRAPGDYDDTACLAAAIAAAGVGGSWELRPNATYTVSAGLQTLANQTLRGNGAKILRAPQVITTTTTPMTVGVTNSVTVNDASGFRVGQDVAFAAQGVARAALVMDSTLSYQRKIIAIVGNVLTFNTAPTCNLPIGSTLFSAFPTLTLGAGSIVENVIVDGNRANHSYCRWEVHGEIYLKGAGAVVRDSQITEAPSEGIWVYADNVLAEHCKLTNIGGNGAHFSACTNAQVVSCRMTDGNLDTDTGHRDGGIAWSLQVKDAVVRDNHITNFIDGIGGMNAVVSSHALIKGNTVRECRRYGIAVAGDITDLAFVDNRVYDCNVAAADGGLFISNGLGSNIRFSGNEFIGCNVSINIGSASAGRWLFEGNTIVGNLVLFGLKGQFARNTVKGQTRIGAVNQGMVNDNLFDRSGVTNDPALDIYWGSNVGLTISNNKIIGGNRGIYCATAATNLLLLNNTCLDQYDKAIFIEDTFERVGLVIQANICRNLAAAPSWTGIDVRCPKATIRDNDVMQQVGANASIGIALASSTCAGTLVTGNTVRGTWVNGAIYLSATTAGAIVRRNNVSSAVNDLGTGNTLADNTAV